MARGGSDARQSPEWEAACSPAKKTYETLPLTKKKLTIRDLGWTRERAREVRAKLASFAADWDDPRMDIYNEP